MEPKPRPGKDGDGQDLPGTVYGEDKASPCLGPVRDGISSVLWLFPPIFEEKTLISAVPSQALCSDTSKEENKGKEPPKSLFFWRQEAQPSPCKLPGW